MAQAKTFKFEELERVLSFVKLTKHAQRNRAILLLTHWAGLRVGEVAGLRMCDVLDANLSVKRDPFGSRANKRRTGSNGVY